MNTSVTYEKNPNPQGKGLVPVLQDIANLKTSLLDPKSPGTFLRDYCLSSFVLSASFAFKPVVGKTYYLYASDPDWTLSLIAPGEWSSEKADTFLAACHLRPDMTWELLTDTMAAADTTSRDALQHYIHTFVGNLASQESISGSLPHYVQELPYYRRLLMCALSSSLKHSIPSSGDTMQTLLQDPACLSLVAPQ